MKSKNKNNQKINKRVDKTGDKLINKHNNKTVAKEMSDDKLVRIATVAVILLITIIIYSNSIKNDFIKTYDDKAYIIDNSFIRDVSVESIKTIFSKHQVANYHPLTTLSWAIEYKYFNLNFKAYHIDNLILHLLNIILIFQLIFLLTKKNEAAIIAALLTAVHPMHVESITWVSERKDVLYSFFYLSSLILYIKRVQSLEFGVRSSKLGVKRGNKLLFFSFILFVLSAFSKSAAITLPIVMLLTDYYYKRKFTFKLMIEKIPFFAISLIFGIAAMVAQRSVGAVNQLYAFNFIDKVFMFFYAIAYYFVSFIIPYKFALIHYYPIKANGLLPIEYYLSPLLIIGVALFVVFKIKEPNLRRDLIFGLSFFVAGLLLILQFIPLGPSIVSERYTYIPYIGLALITGQLYSKFKVRSSEFGVKANNFFFKQTLHVMFLLLLFALLIFFAISTYKRNEVWKNCVTIFDDCAEKYPESDMANYNAGYANMTLGFHKEAIPYFDKAINLDPKYTTAYVNRSLSKYNLKDYKGQVSDCNIAIKQDPNSCEAYVNRGTGRAMLKDYKGAIEDYTKAISMKPDYSYYLNRANAKLLAGEYKSSLEDYNTCQKMNTLDPTVYYNRAVSEYNTDDHKSACEHWNKAVQMGYTPANEKLKQYCK